MAGDRETTQLKISFNEDMRVELNELQKLYPDFNPQAVCLEALKNSIIRYKDGVTRIDLEIDHTKEALNQINSKLDILKEEIYSNETKRTVYEGKLKDLQTLRNKVERQEREEGPKMLFLRAVWELQEDLIDPGMIDEEKAIQLAEDTGVDVAILKQTAKDCKAGVISTDEEIISRMPSLGDILPAK